MPLCHFNLPQRIMFAACLLGFLPAIGLLLFIAFHPLKTEPLTILGTVAVLAFFAFPLGRLFASALLVHELRIISWLLLLPTVLLLLVMIWGSVGDAFMIDSALRDRAAGQHYMNCAGAPLLFTIVFSNFIALPTFVFCVVSFGVYYGVLRSADRNLPPLQRSSPKTPTP